ncbi:MAG: hypothetical protein VX076_03985, partial [Pseudomonadota bacterium]|nr:hypothetical protein [Pseudomonadota bacterium]
IDCSSAAQNGSYIYALFVDNNKGIRDLNSNYYKYAHQVKNQQSLIALFSNGKNRGIKKINLPKVISYPKTLTTIEFESGSLTFDAKFNQNGRYHVSILYDQSFDREGVSLEERFKALGNGMVEFSNPCDAVEAAKAFVSNSVLDVSGFDSIALAPKQAYYAFPNNSACLNRLKTFDPNKHTNVKYTPTIIKHSDDTGEIYIKARAYNDTEHIEIKTTCSKMK